MTGADGDVMGNPINGFLALAFTLIALFSVRGRRIVFHKNVNPPPLSLFSFILFIKTAPKLKRLP